MTYEELLTEIRALTVEQRKHLIMDIVNSLTESPKTRSLLELEGLGAEIWEDIDAQEYVDQLRDEWKPHR